MKKQQSSMLGGALIVAGFVIMIPIMAYGGVMDKIGDLFPTNKLINSIESNMNFYLQRNGTLNYVPQLSPGIVPIDIETKTVDRGLFRRMKDTFKPKSTDSVSYVVAFRCWDKKVGHYTGSGAPGYQKTCNIWVVDARAHLWSNVGTLTGSDPPKTKKGGGSATGSHPVADWLKRIGVI